MSTRRTQRMSAKGGRWVPPYRQQRGNYGKAVECHGTLPWSSGGSYTMHDATADYVLLSHREPWVERPCWCEHTTVRVPPALAERGMTAPCARAECVRFDVEICAEQHARLAG